MVTLEKQTLFPITLLVATYASLQKTLRESWKKLILHRCGGKHTPYEF
jgi:hypothetical protein